MANNLLSVITPTLISTGAYVVVTPANDRRTSLWIQSKPGAEDNHIVVGGVLPTDDARAVVLAAGKVINWNTHAPIGPVYARSVGAASVVACIGD